MLPFGLCLCNMSACSAYTRYSQLLTDTSCETAAVCFRTCWLATIIVKPRHLSVATIGWLSANAFLSYPLTAPLSFPDRAAKGYVERSKYVYINIVHIV